MWWWIAIAFIVKIKGLVFSRCLRRRSKSSQPPTNSIEVEKHQQAELQPSPLPPTIDIYDDNDNSSSPMAHQQSGLHRRTKMTKEAEDEYNKAYGLVDAGWDQDKGPYYLPGKYGRQWRIIRRQITNWFGQTSSTAKRLYRQFYKNHIHILGSIGRILLGIAIVLLVLMLIYVWIVYFRTTDAYDIDNANTELEHSATSIDNPVYREMLKQSGAAHMDSRFEKLLVVGNWKQEEIDNGIKQKQFYSLQQLSLDATFLKRCYNLSDEEQRNKKIELRDYDNPEVMRDYDHAVVSLEDVIRLQQAVLEQGNMIAIPKAWNTTLLPKNFNPCILSMQSDYGMIFHMINPKEYIPTATTIDPAQDHVNLTWSNNDIFSPSGTIPNIETYYKSKFCLKFLDAITYTWEKECWENKRAWAVQFYFPMLTADKSWKKLLFV